MPSRPLRGLPGRFRGNVAEPRCSGLLLLLLLGACTGAGAGAGDGASEQPAVPARENAASIEAAPAAAGSLPPPGPSQSDPAAAPADRPGRRVAITFDDLPFTAGPAEHRCDAEAIRRLNHELLAEVAAHRVPAFGFVNEGRICEQLQGDFLAEMLTLWLDAGHGLGNHTFDHPDFNVTPLADYAASLERGAVLTRRLLAARGRDLVYFRPPYLRTGDTPEKKAAFDRLLAEQGYRLGPVTFDNDEWVFAAAYARAIAAGDEAARRKIGEAYAPWLETTIEHLERRSVAVLGEEPPQVLLLHANWLNANWFGSVAAMLAERGYRFVPLEEALAHPAYSRPDPYVGRRGISWLHRWGLAEGLPVEMEPAAPEWVYDAME
ncbi:MAG TPA: polysaccharide deacetylase family protein [Thermoanaerobaculia bacterium]|nr:polysaccharide deacetylase family protein [Thermoanaerobaculia bacterium]